MTTPSHHPHDRFFRGAFSLRELMVEYVQQFLPGPLSTRLHPESLIQKKDSYLDKNLEQYFSDVVYTVEYGEEKVRITLLLEHKSYVPQHPWLQLLQYMANAYSAQTAEKEFSGKFQPVIPIIIYHGRKKWKVRSVTSYFTGIDEQLRKFVPEFNYILNDLSDYQEEELLAMEGEFANRAFLALKLSRLKDEWKRASLVFSRLPENQPDSTQTNFLQLIFVYLLQSGTSKQTIMAAIDRLESPVKDKVKSAYDQILEEERLRTSFDVFKKAKAMNLTTAQIMELTGVDQATAHAWDKLLTHNPNADFPVT